jgi:hypothetical protein
MLEETSSRLKQRECKLIIPENVRQNLVIEKGYKNDDCFTLELEGMNRKRN